MSMPKTISVVIATHNRASSLSKTLDAMCALTMPEASVSFIVVDNASDDRTPEVLRAFTSRMNLQSLHEPKSGKNNALNRALDECELSDVVVFTDDDVVPDTDWLVAIAESCHRRPDIHVFGGRIDIAWPIANVPGWAQSGQFSDWAFAKLDFGDQEMQWPPAYLPFGPNFWVRRDVFDNGRRFNPHLGPRPKGRLMGGESAFLDLLRKEGHEILYVPSARVQHCISRKILTIPGIRERAFTMGRTGANLRAEQEFAFFDEHRLLWGLRKGAMLARYLAAYGVAHLTPNVDRRASRMIAAMWGLGWHSEMVRLVRERNEQPSIGATAVASEGEAQHVR